MIKKINILTLINVLVFAQTDKSRGCEFAVNLSGSFVNAIVAALYTPTE